MTINNKCLIPDPGAVSREFESVVGRRRQLLVMFGTLYAGMSVYIDQVVAERPHSLLNTFQIPAMWVYLGLLAGLSAVIAVRLALLHFGMVYHGIIWAAISSQSLESEEIAKAKDFNDKGVSAALVSLCTVWAASSVACLLALILQSWQAILPVVLILWWFAYRWFYRTYVHESAVVAAEETMSEWPMMPRRSISSERSHDLATLDMCHQDMIALTVSLGLLVFSLLQTLSVLHVQSAIGEYTDDRGSHLDGIGAVGNHPPTKNNVVLGNSVSLARTVLGNEAQSRALITRPSQSRTEIDARTNQDQSAFEHDSTGGNSIGASYIGLTHMQKRAGTFFFSLGVVCTTLLGIRAYNRLRSAIKKYSIKLYQSGGTKRYLVVSDSALGFVLVAMLAVFSFHSLVHSLVLDVLLWEPNGLLLLSFDTLLMLFLFVRYRSLHHSCEEACCSELSVGTITSAAAGCKDNTQPVTICDTEHLSLVSKNGWDWVERKRGEGVVVIVAIDDKHRVLLVEQYREPIGRCTLELPAGLVADSFRESACKAAKRELLEETGYEAQCMHSLGSLLSSPGLTNESVEVFLAEGLDHVEDDGGDVTESIRIVWLGLEGLSSHLMHRGAVDSKLLAAIHLAHQYRTRIG